ncbi:MAG: hypothetical protein WA761_09800 [Thermoplasmata archaeon]
MRGPGPHASTVTECWWYSDTNGTCYFTSVGGTYSFYAYNTMFYEGGQVLNYTGNYPA